METKQSKNAEETCKGEWHCEFWMPDPYYFCTMSDNGMPSDENGMCDAATDGCDEAEFITEATDETK